uniref:Uncharacterized protein n=1 Tax=Rhizophora mucronata TaxID=61149 RepID=A0A2P2MXM2_RHIMU
MSIAKHMHRHVIQFSFKRIKNVNEISNPHHSHFLLPLINANDK